MLLLPLLLVSMDVSVLYFAVPYISEEISPSSTEQLWMFDIYGFVLAGTLLTMGWLGDRIGRRKLLLIGTVGFGLASVAAAYASSPLMLIIARGVLGIAGAVLTPTTAGLIRNMFHDEKQRQTAVAIWTGGLAGGIGLGPVMSGLLLEHFWWGSVFLVNLPFMAMLLILTPLLVPESRDPNAGRFDWISSFLSLAAILPIIYGIKEWAANGVNGTRIGAIAVGVVIGLLFVLRQRRPDPMIDLRLLSRREINGPVFSKMIAMFCLVGMSAFTAQYLQSVYGLTPLVAGLWSLLPSAGVSITTPIVTILLKKGVHRSILVSVGYIIGIAAFAVLTLATPDSGIWVILLSAGMLAGGLVIVMTLATELLVGSAPPERASIAAATLETGAQLGGALGLAVMGSVAGAVYRDEVVGALPNGLPESATAAVEQTLGGAVAVSGQLPKEIGDAVLGAAREAFTNGVQTTAYMCMALLAAGTVFAATYLRKVNVRPDAVNPDLIVDAPVLQDAPMR
ncbi:MFS transporter [Streptomyces sp. NPDC002181]|uniref:MFS transporter n=1 Tax=unclassified Streptomyces TaxID=2593676 RepID=UPI003653039D